MARRSSRRPSACEVDMIIAGYGVNEYGGRWKGKGVASGLGMFGASYLLFRVHILTSDSDVCPRRPLAGPKNSQGTHTHIPLS